MLQCRLRFRLSVLIQLVLFISSALAAIASNWTNPNARLPSFSSTYLVGERIYLSWQPLNNSLNDLWLIRYDLSNENFALRIASTLDISKANSFPWTISVSEEEVLVDTRFAFVFIPEGLSYDKDIVSDLESPAFNLMLVNQATPPNGTVITTTIAGMGTATSSSSSATVASSSDGSSSPLSAVHDDSSSLSYKEITGISIGILAAVGLAGFLGGYLLFRKRQARHNRKISTTTDVPMTGPYEVLGSSKGPAEINGKETKVHEMNSSHDTLAHESDSAPIHEVANTVKRPGIHEMPG